MHTDPIADMLTRIRNASMARKPEARISMSRLNKELARVLEEQGWIGTVSVDESGLHAELVVKIRYDKGGNPHISHIKRVSKPGLRVYARHDELPYVRNGFGIAIVSTPKGLMTNKRARKERIGGEVLCEVY